MMIHFVRSILLLVGMVLNGLHTVTSSAHMRYPGVPITFGFRTSESGGFTFFSVDKKDENKLDSLQVSNVVSKPVPSDKIKQKQQKKDTPLVKVPPGNTNTRTTNNNVFRTAVPVNVNDDWRSMNFFTSNKLKGTAQTKSNDKKKKAKLLKIEEANTIVKKARNGKTVKESSRSKSRAPVDSSFRGSLGIGNRNFDDWSKYLLGQYNWIPTSGKTNYDESLNKYPILPNMINDNPYELLAIDHNGKSVHGKKVMAKPKFLANTRLQIVKNVSTKNIEKKRKNRVTGKTIQTAPKLAFTDAKNVNMIKNKGIKPKIQGNTKSVWNVKLRETKPVIPIIPKAIGGVSVNASKENANMMNNRRLKSFNTFRFSPLREIKPVKPVIPANVENIEKPVQVSTPMPIKTPLSHGISIVNSPLREEKTPVKPFIPNNVNNIENKNTVETFTTIKDRQLLQPKGVNDSPNKDTVETFTTLKHWMSLQPKIESKSKQRILKKLSSKLKSKKMPLGTSTQDNNIKEKQKPIQNKNVGKKIIPEQNKQKPKRVRVYLSELSPSYHHKNENHTDGKLSDSSVKDKVSESKKQKQVKITRKVPMASWRSRPQWRVKSSKAPKTVETKVPVNVIMHKRVWPKLDSLMQEVKKLNVIIHENETRTNFTRLISNSIHGSKPGKEIIPISRSKQIKNKVIQKLGKPKRLRGGKVRPMKSWRSIYKNKQIKKPESHLKSNQIVGSNLRLGDILSSRFPGSTILIPNNQAESGINKIRKHKLKTSKLSENHLSKSEEVTDNKFTRKHLKIASRNPYTPTDQPVASSQNVQLNDFKSNSNFMANDKDNSNMRRNTNVIDTSRLHENEIENVRPKRKYLSDILKSSDQQTDIGDQNPGSNLNAFQQNVVPSEVSSTVTEHPTTQSQFTSGQIDTTTDVINHHDSNYNGNMKVKTPAFQTTIPPLNADDKTTGTSDIHSNTGNMISDKVPEFMNPFGLTLFDANMKPLSLEDMISILQDANIAI